MHDRQRDYHVEAIVVTDERSDPRIQTPDGIRNELRSHFEYLGATVHLVNVVPAGEAGNEDQKGEGQ